MRNFKKLLLALSIVALPILFVPVLPSALGYYYVQISGSFTLGLNNERVYYVKDSLDCCKISVKNSLSLYDSLALKLPPLSWQNPTIITLKVEVLKDGKVVYEEYVYNQAGLLKGNYNFETKYFQLSSGNYLVRVTIEDLKNAIKESKTFEIKI